MPPSHLKSKYADDTQVISLLDQIRTNYRNLSVKGHCSSVDQQEGHDFKRIENA